MNEKIVILKENTHGFCENFCVFIFKQCCGTGTGTGGAVTF
jgi:hypothetical protein